MSLPPPPSLAQCQPHWFPQHHFQWFSNQYAQPVSMLKPQYAIHQLRLTSEPPAPARPSASPSGSPSTTPSGPPTNKHNLSPKSSPSVPHTTEIVEAH
jgi:hypothetical protein